MGWASITPPTTRPALQVPATARPSQALAIAAAQSSAAISAL